MEEMMKSLSCSQVFVGYEEVVVSNDKGRRVVHYYLKEAGGGKELAVVGREKSVRHMTYTVRNQFAARSSSTVVMGKESCSSPSSSSTSGLAPPLKWKSRREVINWLSDIVSDSVPYGTSPLEDRFSEDEDAEPTNIPTSKGVSSGKMGHHSKEFSWLGSAWNCRKRRKHYRSFCRNGITISVHDFVYVMAEENKRLVAYVEDLYEDLRANNMVVVRWFHKVDEVGIVLSTDVNDREIFFSLCLQDFSVECIDGLAAVLSAQHFDKFQNDARHRFSSWEPYLCRRQIDNDDVKPFDVTQVQGYWSQEVLRSIFATPDTSLKLRLKITHGGPNNSLNGDEHGGPKKKKHRLNDGNKMSSEVFKNVNKSRGTSVVGSRGEKNVLSTTSAPHLLRKELLKHKFQQQQQQQHLAPGSQVEVLSQDSGIRGCWFSCVVLKRHHDRLKVCYKDVQDADGSGNLEEWVSASRVASPDKLGIRFCGRPVVRPYPSHSGKISCSFDVGAIVDARWHDGWWEGIVVHKESGGKICVYFPGEQQVSLFNLGEIRRSRDWLGNKWNHIKDRPDVASSLLSDINLDSCKGLSNDGQIPIQAPVSNRKFEEELQRESSAAVQPVLSGEQLEGKEKVAVMPKISLVGRMKGASVPNLARACQLDGLKWSSSRKRRRSSELSKHGSNHKRQSSSSSSQEELEEESNACEGFLLPKSLTVDQENCKVGGVDPLLAAPMSLCSSLVMSM